jgi:hypothetical protein
MSSNQVKNYASKVARAKEVAAAHHKKETEETLARRRALEDRLRASEDRRRYLLTVPRSRLLDPMELPDSERSAVRDSAARMIQRWYRNATVAPLIQMWKESSLTISKANSMPFEKLVGVVQAKAVIRSAAGILGYLKKLAKVVSRFLTC